MAPSASAAVADATVTASDTPLVFPTVDDQPAGDWNVTTGAGTFLVGEQFALSVGDSDSGAAANCLISGDEIGFGAATPTVTINAPTAASDQAVFSVSTTSTGAACATAGVKNTLILTVTHSGTATDFDISGITYSVGDAVSPGPIDVVAGQFNGTGNTAVTGSVDVSGAANAFISPVRVTANVPPTGVRPGTSGNPVSNVTIQEFQPGAVGSSGDFVCLTIVDITSTGSDTDPGDVTFGGTPTISATGGGSEADNIQLGTGDPAPTTSTQITFEVTDPSTTGPGTFTVGGITINTPNPNDFGQVLVTVSSGADRDAACASGEIATGVPAPTVVLTSIIGVERIAGSNRFATARALGSDAFGCAQTALIARGDVFADALAGSYLAGWFYAPILLSGNNSVPTDTIQALREMGVRNVILLGQTAALSQAVATQLAGTPQYECGGGDQVSSRGWHLAPRGHAHRWHRPVRDGEAAGGGARPRRGRHRRLRQRHRPEPQEDGHRCQRRELPGCPRCSAHGVQREQQRPRLLRSVR